MKIAVPIAALVWALAAPASAQIVSGPAAAIDGRTLDMAGTPIRLAHIDAPEGQQMCTRDSLEWACGREAKESLDQIVRAQTVRCTILSTDPDQVKRALCETASFDIGREMVRRGLAMATPYAPPEYGQAEGIAETMAFGLWSGEFERPDEWRASRPEASLSFVFESAPQAAVTPSAPAPQPMSVPRRYSNAMGCAIKGNHSRRGDWIYHLPGQRYYEVTRPEDVFCTEEEARAAGYRRSKE